MKEGELVVIQTEQVKDQTHPAKLTIDHPLSDSRTNFKKLQSHQQGQQSEKPKIESNR
jgi:hypothetical protein